MFGDQTPLEVPIKYLVIWLGKYVGMSYIHTVHLEGYTTHALAKIANSNVSQMEKWLHEKAKTKDHLSHKKT